MNPTDPFLEQLSTSSTTYPSLLFDILPLRLSLSHIFLPLSNFLFPYSLNSSYPLFFMTRRKSTCNPLS